jgi:hypothetical protein
LPAQWQTMALRNIKAFNRSFDIVLTSGEEGVWLSIRNEEKIFFNQIVQPENPVIIRLDQ